MAQKYIAFISYRHAELDSAIAKSLHSLIEQYRIPRGVQKTGKKRLGVVFRDQEELHAASDLSAEIQNALNATEYLIVICSKNSVESPWVTREVDHFLENHDRSQVFTVLASGEPMEVFPPQLTRTPEGEPIEPLAVDVRADTIAGCRKKLRKELPRLIAAMLKCPYDALVMREQKRKTRRIMSIAAGAMAILLGFTSMVLLKNNQIALANNQLEVKNVELNQANVALEEQKAAVQLRESQLLVQSALEDLDNADYYSAMQKAVDALPADASDNRPYYAPAEQVLMEALGVFQTETEAESLNTTVLEQVTNISHFVITEDGTRVMTTDKFGTVFCFDAESGQQLWHQYAAQETDGSSTPTYYLFLCNDDQTLVRSGKRTLYAYDVATGHSLWSLDVGFITEDYLFYHKTRDVLLFAGYYTNESRNNTYQLTEVDLATGQILQAIPVYDGSSIYSCTFSDSNTNTLSKAGYFYNDGTGFCGIFLDPDKYLRCFDVDLGNGTCDIIYTSPEPLDSGTDPVAVFRDADHNIYTVCTDTKEDCLISALKIDANTGSVIWEQHIPTPATISYRLYKGSYALGFQHGILVSCGHYFFMLDLQTGALSSSKSMADDITSLAFVSENTFAFSLDDGTYAIGWTNPTDGSITLTTDPNYNVYTKLETHTSVQPWGGGIIQLYINETRFWLGVGNYVCPGSVLLIPKQQENTLHIIKPVHALAQNDFTTLQMPAEDFELSYDATVTPVGNSLSIGRCYTASGNAHMFLDSVTQQTLEVYNYTDYYSDSTLFWIPDTRQPLICVNYDGIALINDDGTKTELYNIDNDQLAWGEIYEWYPSISIFRCASGYLSDGSLLSAACNPETLQLWNNGVFTKQTDLPAELITDPVESTKKERVLKIGANGYVLVSLHDYQRTIPLENVWVYNPVADTWKSFRSDAVFSDDSAMTFAREKSLMAGVDQNGVVRILDLETGNTVGRFPTQLPSGSVLQMQFFLDDAYLAIKAAGGHLLIYEVATGTQVYRDQVSNAYAATLQVFEDLTNNRLYLNCGPESSLCLDLNSWTTLAKLDNLIYYDSNTDQVYLITPDRTMAYGKIPATNDLVKLATDILAEQ